MLVLALRDVYPISMRAARVMTICTFKNPDLIKPHVASIIKILPQFKVDGVKRSLLKIFAELPLHFDDDSLGILTDVCFKSINDQKEAIAVRAFSIGILLNISQKYPEIKPELKSILESILPECSVGLKSKGRKTLKLLK
jgi:hypothetical protein